MQKLLIAIDGRAGFLYLFRSYFPWHHLDIGCLRCSHDMFEQLVQRIQAFDSANVTLDPFSRFNAVPTEIGTK